MKYPRKIYAIRHNTTNRVYIGSSCNVDVRVYSHIAALRSHRHSVWDMQKDFDEYGEDFSISILDSINGADEAKKEYEWMDKYQSFVRGIGYNYKDYNRSRQRKQAMDDGEPLIVRGTLTDSERELLDIVRGAQDPLRAFLTAVSVINCYLHPEWAALTQTSATAYHEP